MRNVSKSTSALGILFFSSMILLIFVYLILRIVAFLFADYPFIDKFVASFLLIAEIFAMIHALGYFFASLKVALWGSTSLVAFDPPPLKDFPPVIVVVPAYHEPIDVLRNTLICLYNITYPNKTIVLLDDTRYDGNWGTEEEKRQYKKGIEELTQFIGVDLFRRKWRGAKAGIINDFLGFIEGKPIEELSFFPFQGEKELLKHKYLVIFDADMNPFPDFMERLVAYMEEDPKAAFIQTPQYYTNFETNRVARVAGLQQIVFFEHICEGKGVGGAMFCCGTNVMFRLSALQEVGGFEEQSVTEDIATSLKLHCLGWKSLYFNKNIAFGMGPEDLGAYFKQQFRWALGTISLLKPLFYAFFTQCRSLPISTWWEYFLSSSHYLTGWFFFIMYLFPILYIFFDVPSYFVNTKLYLYLFFPYVIFSLSLVYWTLRLQRMRPTHIGMTMVINAIMFPIFMKAALYAIVGKRSSFVVTPKGKGEPLPLWELKTLLSFILLSTMALTWGGCRLYYEREPFLGIAINLFWIMMNLLMMLSVLYFNNPEESQEAV